MCVYAVSTGRVTGIRQWSYGAKESILQAMTDYPKDSADIHVQRNKVHVDRRFHN